MPKKLTEICNTCGTKCCKPNLVASPFNLNLAPGDFSTLLKNGHWVVLSIGYHTSLGPSFVISPHIFGFCSFLDYTSNKCKIYDQRPSLCKNFPFDPQIDNPVKKFCLLFIQTSRYLQMKYEREYQRLERDDIWQRKLKSKEEEDQDAYFNIYKRKESTLNFKETLINNKLGSFLFTHLLNISVDNLGLFALLEEYSSFFALNQIVINAKIVNDKRDLISKVEGVYKSGFHFTKDNIQAIIANQTSYYLNKYNGSYLEGILYLTDLKKPIPDWQICWYELQSAFNNFTPQFL